MKITEAFKKIPFTNKFWLPLWLFIAVAAVVAGFVVAGLISK